MRVDVQACAQMVTMRTMLPWRAPVTMAVAWRDQADDALLARDWPCVESMLQSAVPGELVLPGEKNDDDYDVRLGSPGQQSGGRITWHLKIAYFGPAFSGFAWQRDSPKPTVEGCLQTAIWPLLDGKSELRLQCAGRTDAGVSATGQLISFHSWPRVTQADLERAINEASPAPGALRLVAARHMASGYHATYSTTWRRYAYYLPSWPGATRDEVATEAAALDALLRPLCGVARDFRALGRSLPAGKDTNTLLRHASARLVMPAGEESDAATPMTRIELVGDRFLRQQVRTLVATAASVAAGIHPVCKDDNSFASEGLLAVCTSGREEETACPAPPLGLVLVGAGTPDELALSWRTAAEAEAALLPTSASATDEDGYEYDEALDEEYGGGEGTSRPSDADVSRDAISSALMLLQQQQESGAPLDALLARHVRAYSLSQAERQAVSTHLEHVVRCQARLDCRLRACGVDPTPRARLLASLQLRSSARPPLQLPDTAIAPAEAKWLAQLEQPLEAGITDESALLECPAWAWEGFRAAFGGSAVAEELRALQEPAPIDLRVNTLKTTRAEALAAIRSAGFAAEPTPLSPLGIRLEERAVALGRIPGLLAGHVQPQDEGSQLLALLVDAKPGEIVMDYCAGAGGKTLALAAEMGNKGRLVAADIDEGRLANSAPRLAKAGVSNVQRHTLVVTGKDKWLKRRKRSFDRVLVDAPCSGVGAWRRNPDARWLRRTRSVTDLLPVQADVLRRAARLVRPGGVLVYATCSVLLEENDEQVAAFLASEEGEEFTLSPPVNFHVPLDGAYLRLTPARHGCDGFFGAVLRRREGGWTRRGKKRP